MTNPGDKGSFEADIPAGLVEEALRSVEGSGRGTEGGESDPAFTGLRARVDELEGLLGQAEERLRQAEERQREAHERSLRIAADLENYRKRINREREDTVRFGNERIVKDLLPIVDNLERAVSAGGGEGLLEGVKLVLRQFTDTLARYEVRAFSSLGQPFDPNRHEALMQQESAEVPNGTVLTEILKGYTLHERLIRPAAVVVSRAPADAPAPQEDAAEDSTFDGANGEERTGPH